MDYPVSPADKRARRGIVLAMSPKATGPAARADRSPLLSLAVLGVVLGVLTLLYACYRLARESDRI